MGNRWRAPLVLVPGEPESFELGAKDGELLQCTLHPDGTALAISSLTRPATLPEIASALAAVGVSGVWGLALTPIEDGEPPAKGQSWIKIPATQAAPAAQLVLLRPVVGATAVAGLKNPSGQFRGLVQ